MKAKLRIYDSCYSPPRHDIITINPHGGRYFTNLHEYASYRAEQLYPDATLVSVAKLCQSPLEYDCAECESPVGVRCTHKGTVLGYFHDPRKIEAGILEPPPYRWERRWRRWRPGKKTNNRAYHKHAYNQFDRKRKNRKERRAAKALRLGWQHEISNARQREPHAT